jgi:hypothetical protein
MLFRLLNQVRRDASSKESTSGLTVEKHDPDKIAQMARAAAADQRAIQDARARLSGAYQNLLQHMDQVYKSQDAEQRARVEANYEVWASFFELIKTNFKDAWAFFGVVQADVHGWYRTAPTGSPYGFMAPGRSGYSFAIGLEQNSKRGAPRPKKWLTVSLAHAASYEAGIGDERLIGRPAPITDELVGLAGCNDISRDKQEDGSLILKGKVEEFPLVFTLSNESNGQHTTQVPLSALQRYTLTELCQPLLVALTNEDLKAATALLPTAKRLQLE